MSNDELVEFEALRSFARERGLLLIAKKTTSGCDFVVYRTTVIPHVRLGKRANFAAARRFLKRCAAH